MPLSLFERHVTQMSKRMTSVSLQAALCALFSPVCPDLLLTLVFRTLVFP